MSSDVFDAARTLRRTAALIAAVALIPALSYIALNRLTGVYLPDYVADAAIIMVLSIESLICVFAARTSVLAARMESVYVRLISTGLDLEKDLRRLGRVAKRFKRLLPDVVELLDNIDPEKVKAFLSIARRELKRWSPEEQEDRRRAIREAAERAVEERRTV